MLLLLVLLLAVQAQNYRPVSLGDLVDAVGSNQDGLEGVDLSPLAADHAIFFGDDAVGFAARVRDDPDGPIVVAWRRPNELWQYRYLEEAGLAAIQAPAVGSPRLGAVAGLRSLGRYVMLETRVAAASGSTVSSVLLQQDLAAVAIVTGIARTALPDGAVIVQQAAGDRGVALAVLTPATRRLTTFYELSRASLSSPHLDPAADTLTFIVTFVDGPSKTGRLTCRAISQPSRRCTPGA
jgi:hypothetical protein